MQTNVSDENMKNQSTACTRERTLEDTKTSLYKFYKSGSYLKNKLQCHE